MTPSLCVIRLPTEDMLPLDFITTIHPFVKKRIPWGDFLQEGHLFAQEIPIGADGPDKLIERSSQKGCIFKDMI